jgi:DNA-binding NarL/FixJ family response regulator
MSRKIRIILADDQAMVRKGFRLILSQEPDMEIIAEARLGHDGPGVVAKSKGPYVRFGWVRIS